MDKKALNEDMDKKALNEEFRLAIIGELEDVKSCIERGADKEYRIDSQEFTEFTPILYAAYWGRLEIVQYLDSVGCDKKARDSDGETALHLAASRGHPRVTEWLIEKGGMNPFDKSERGKTAYDLAAKIGNDHTARKMGKKRVAEYLKIAMSKEGQDALARIKKKGLQDETKMLSDKKFKDLIRTSSYKCYWNRIFLTGQFDVGKTTLAKILVGDKAPEERKSTDGIWIYLGRAGMNIRERTWIFVEKGTILNATVQSFLRSEASTKPRTEKPNEQTVHQGTVKPKQATIHLDSVKPIYSVIRVDDNVAMLKAILNLPNLIRRLYKGRSPKIVKTPVISNEKMEGTSIDNSSMAKEMFDYEIIKLVRSECDKGKYEMTIVPIDLWDFGGQKIYHLTHQLFITSRGTFVLVFKGGEVIQEEEKAYLVRWVNSILTYCKRSKKNEEYPKILFVATHKDKVKGDIEEQRHSLEDSIEMLFKTHGGKAHLKYRPLIFVDARNKEDKEIDVLKKQLVEVALNHPSCGESMPTKFVPLEIKLAEKGEGKEKIITMKELKDMNTKNDNMALDNDELELFLKVNHALGKLIYFDEACLRDKIITDPVFLIDVLRSIITGKLFWPTHLCKTFEALEKSGKLLKKDLFEIWMQECFLEISEHKEYMVEMLVHLDIICRQKNDDNGSDFFLVPCMISTKREENVQLQFDNSIHLAYTFREEVIPPAILYRFIATFITIWKLQVREKSNLMLFTDSADVSIDKEHNMRFDIKRNKLIITLSHKDKQTAIVSTIASTAQECLTHAITKISNFYFSVTDNFHCTRELLFTIEIGIVCGTNLCFVDHKLLPKEEWICPEHKRKHKTDIVSRWFADKLPRTGDKCYKSCPGLDNAWLDNKPDDKRLGRLAVELTKAETRKMYMHLKKENTDKSWTKLDSNNAEGFDININALHDWKKSTLNTTFRSIHESMKENDIDIHKLCQILRDVRIQDFEPSRHATAKWNLKPSRSDIKLLPNHIGKETFQLGIELGLTVVEMHQIQMNHVKDLRSQTEDVLAIWRRNQKATYEVLVKTLYRLDLSSVLEYLTYDVGLKEQLEDKIMDNENSIIQQIQTNQILDYMMTYLVISADDRLHIDHYPRQDDKNKELLKIVFERIESTFTVFLEALESSGYKDLVKQLKCDDLSRIATLATAATEGISEDTVPVCMVQLQKNYSNIVSNVTPDGIVDALVSSDVLTIEDNQMINACSTQHQKNRVLVDQILRKSEKEFTEFLTALREDHAELAKQIQGTKVTSRDISTIQSCYKQGM